MLIGGTRRSLPGSWAWPAGLVVWGPGHVADSHAHHATQLVMALRGRLRMRRAPGTPWRLAGGVLVRPDAPHEVDARGLPVLIAFIDPESRLGRALVDRARGPLTPITGATLRRWRRLVGAPSSTTESRVRAWVEQELGGVESGRPLHPGVAAVQRLLRGRTGDLGDTSLAHLARIARLSPSRLTHVFSASVGIPLRRYVLWLRVQRAADALTSGHTATQAAYIAGFSDAAHLTRTFRRMLGCPPTEVMRRQKDTGELRLDDRPDRGASSTDGPRQGAPERSSRR